MRTQPLPSEETTEITEHSIQRALPPGQLDGMFAATNLPHDQETKRPTPNAQAVSGRAIMLLYDRNAAYRHDMVG
ncbi:hypothetical protein KFU94_49790 [Chloroflexi bacterium TSY]|nr:hypothetical protein [Chloroflexi bacterium TSY]